MHHPIALDHLRPPPTAEPMTPPPHDRSLAGRHAIVTGGGRGIGAAIGAELARQGATLTLMGRDVEALEARARDLMDEHAVEVLAVRCDVSDPASVAEAFRCSAERWPTPWALVNNAGLGIAAPVQEITLEAWERVLAVNLTGPLLCIQQVLPAMRAAGGGRIVTIASTAALKGYTNVAAYTASKHGALGLVRALALETAKEGITVNAVCPGYTETDMAHAAIDNVVARTGRTAEEARRLLVRHNPRGTLIQPVEVASAVAWLCSPGASAVTGQALVVAGGELS
jgi:NAD(P)-dependent dehydrogenase (short-subunit alcohol dehydrogenase family)